VLFLTSQLGYGGAERQLVNLALELRRMGHAPAVALFYAGGPLDGELARGGVPIHDLRKRGRWETASFLARLVRLLRRERPDVLHPYLEVPNVVATLAAPLAGRVRVVWGIRNSNMDHRQYGGLARAVYRVEGALAPRADALIANSMAGASLWAERGVRRDRIAVVPNGIDCARFQPDLAARAAQRGAWEVGARPLVGVVARLDAMKGHSVFLEAAARVSARTPEVCFALVGAGEPGYEAQLRSQAERLGLSSRVRWIAPGLDMRAVYNALDLLVLPSRFGEGFPNVVAEAMACGTPCVATDVGDARMVLGDCGSIVPPEDPVALAAAIEQALGLLGEERARIAHRARERISARFSTRALAERTAAVLGAIMAGRPVSSLSGDGE
jgi:glycosyltransferase involved in cell wall biosynthesis